MQISLPLEQPESIVARFFRRCGVFLLSPHRFFSVEVPQMTHSEAVVLGVVSAWIGGGIAWITGSLQAIFFAKLMDAWLSVLLPSEDMPISFFTEPDVSSQIMGAGMIVLLPVLVLLRELYFSLFSYGFARLLVPRSQKPLYAELFQLRLTCHVSYWLQVIPFVGGVLSVVSFWVYFGIGLRQKYSISGARAFVIVMGPVFLALCTLAITGMLSLLALSMAAVQGISEMGI